MQPMPSADDIDSTYLHFKDSGQGETVPVTDSFWAEVAAGQRPQLDQGRLMCAFSFSAPWPTWEKHPAGEELVMLLSGEATLVLDEAGGHRSVLLQVPGSFVLVPRNVWHTARTTVPTRMLFLTPGAGTEHRPVEG